MEMQDKMIDFHNEINNIVCTGGNEMVDVQISANKKVIKININPLFCNLFEKTNLEISIANSINEALAKSDVVIAEKFSFYMT